MIAKALLEKMMPDQTGRCILDGQMDGWMETEHTGN